MRALAVCFAVAALAACNQGFDVPGAGDDAPPGPGSPTWDDTDLTCGSTDDCAPGERCDAGTCRPKQCDDGPYESAVPLGPSHVFFREQELLVIDSSASQGSYWVDGYDAAGAIAYTGGGGGSYSVGSTALVDVARVHTANGGGFVTASAGSSAVRVTGRAFAPFTVQVGLVPVAIGAGDVDGDAIEDLVALSAAGQIAVCKLAGGCRNFSFGGGTTAKDIAVADTNGDGVAEVIFLLRSGDSTQLAVWTIDAAEGGFVAATFGVHFDAVTAGDIDHDGRAEVAALEDRGWLGFASDRIHIYRVGAGFTGVTAVSTLRSAVDLSAGDGNGSDGGDSLVVLGDNRSVDVLRWNGSSVANAFTGTVSATTSPIRIALGDVDDDSVSAKLLNGPELVPGRLVPTMVVTFPPYLDYIVDGDVSSVAVGERHDTSEDTETTVSLEAGVEVGVEADFVGLFAASLSTKLSTEISRSRTLGKQWSVGTHFSLEPHVELYGNQYGAVVVACNCFHAYEYQLVDPANRAGGTGRRITLIVPVGGQTTVMSTSRYGALAERIDLPEVRIATRIGDPTSYPRSPTKLDGTAVGPDEHVFPTRPTLRVSDVGTVGFSMSVGTSETNSAALTTTVSVGGSISALGVQVGAELGAGWGRSYAITIGSSAEFSGDVPLLADDPATQEDEYQLHAFSFSPYIYRQPYTDPVSGEASGYYVIDYAVGGP